MVVHIGCMDMAAVILFVILGWRGSFGIVGDALEIDGGREDFSRERGTRRW